MEVEFKAMLDDLDVLEKSLSDPAPIHKIQTFKTFRNKWVENADRWVARFLEMFKEGCHKMRSLARNDGYGGGTEHGGVKKTTWYHELKTERVAVNRTRLRARSRCEIVLSPYHEHELERASVATSPTRSHPPTGINFEAK
ncbi:hypothetical protein F2Q68_00012906 [Brassica cretica]|uniref:Uncharacterized protein n=1 Tax=Brassica cretica TaxID=69181 RepID=A0A8S9HS22_BRACR|nr:hypothetical protein F2Q68_00012906 [Brassica cretica]